MRLAQKDPAFTLVVAGTLALSIGFNATLFTIVSGMGATFRVAQPDRMVKLEWIDVAGSGVGVSYLDFADWRAAAKTLDAAATYTTGSMILTDRGLPADRVAGAYISEDTFGLLGEKPVLGRDLTADDNRPGAEPVCIIAQALWETRYERDSSIVGRTITINGVPVTVVGVMRKGFRFPLVHDLWQPIAALPGLAAQTRDARRLQAFGRLAPGARLEQARDELAAIGSSLARSYPATNANIRPTATQFSEGGFHIANPWDAMRAAVSIVLLIACANIANLLLGRAASRSTEIAIRTSLGASRWRIVRQLMIESGLLATLGGAAGVGVAIVGVRLWLASMPIANWPYWFHFEIDARAFAYIAEITLASALLSGIAPAVHISKGYPGERLKDAGRGDAAGPSVRRWTNALLGVEFALTFSLLAGAGLLARTLLAVYRADSIVDTSHVVLAGVDLPPQKYGMPAERIAFYSALESRVGADGSVEATALASDAPFYNAASWSLTRQVDQLTRTSDVPRVSYVLIGPRYFDTLRLRLIRGRVFTDLDGRPGHNTVIINQLLASRFFPRADPIGQQIRLTDPANPDEHAPWLTVVGVSPTVRQHYAQEIDPVAYVPYRQNPAGGMVLMTRSRSDAASLTPMLREQVRELDPDLPLTDIMALDWLVSGTRFANRVSATLFGISATLALLLATVGLYTIIAYAIHRRTREIGIRIALGAQRSQILWLFVSRVVRPLACGLALGLGGAFAVGRIIGGMLIQTSPHDPLTLIAISVVLIAAATAALVLPARRITRLEPASALRHA